MLNQNYTSKHPNLFTIKHLENVLNATDLSKAKVGNPVLGAYKALKIIWTSSAKATESRTKNSVNLWQSNF